MADRTVPRSTAVLAAVVAAIAAGGIGVAVGLQYAPSSSAPAAVGTTTTTIPRTLYVGQGRDWILAHGEDLTLISTWARNLGDAASAHDGRSRNHCCMKLRQYNSRKLKLSWSLPI